MSEQENVDATLSELPVLDEVAVEEENPEDVVDQATNDASDKRKKRMVAGVLAGVCVVVLAGASVAFALNQPQADTPVPKSQEQSETKQVASKTQEKSEIKVLVKAEGVTDTSTKAKVAVVGKDGLALIPECEVKANEQVKIGELAAGEYELQVTGAPVNADGSTYKLPDAAIKFKVEEKSAEVKLECALSKIAKEDMTKEQLEATAGVLEASGNAGAAAQARSSAQTAPSVPDSASSVQKPAPSPSPAPNPNPTPTPPSGGSSGGSTPTPSEPDKPSHSHSFTAPVMGNGAPIYGNGAAIYGDGAPIYSQQAIYGSKCNYCGSNISGNAAQHGMQFDESDLAHAIASYSTDVVVGYEQVLTGYEQVVVGYEQVLTGYEQVVVGYKCSCGASQ